jgi:hypothetical protein
MRSSWEYIRLRDYRQYLELSESELEATRTTYYRDFVSRGGDLIWAQLGYGTWIEHTQSYLEALGTPIYRLRYEDLKSDAVGTLHNFLLAFGIEFPLAYLEEVVEDCRFERMKQLEVEEVRNGQAGFFFQPKFYLGHAAGLRFMSRGDVIGSGPDLPIDIKDAALDRFGPLMSSLSYTLEEGGRI